MYKTIHNRDGRSAEFFSCCDVVKNSKIAAF